MSKKYIRPQVTELGSLYSITQGQMNMGYSDTMGMNNPNDPTGGFMMMA